MHELSYVMKIIPLAVDAAQKEHMDNVSTVEIEVGEMTGALPELLEKAYRESIPGTPLEDSDLVVHMIPVTAVCDECNHEYHPSKENDYRCTNCGGIKSHIIGGRDVTLKSISN